jgi:hypothetical protein
MGKHHPLSVVSLLVGGISLGAVLGIGSLAATPGGRAAVATSANNLAITMGWKRQREPQAGDFWGGCNDARAAGTAPIYRGEPGYRPEMDGDSDGIACEPHRG